MYTLTRVQEEFKAVCGNAGVPVPDRVPIKINSRLSRTLGRVSYIQKADGYCSSIKVEFSKKFLETASDESVREVIYHEAAHFIVTERTHENHGHDSLFKAVCAEIGTTNDHCSFKYERADGQEIEKENFKYDVICPHCHSIVAQFNRKGKTLKNISACRCALCGNDGLEVIQNW